MGFLLWKKLRVRLAYILLLMQHCKEYCTVYCTVHWVMNFFTVLRLNIDIWPPKKRDINPLTTTQFMKPLYITITVMSVSQSNYSNLCFNNIDNNEIDFSHNTNNNFNHNKTNDDALINEDTYDHVVN